MQETITLERQKPVSREWIEQTLTVKTSINRELAKKISEEVHNELCNISLGITRNLVTAVICLKLAENNLIREQKEFVKRKVFESKCLDEGYFGGFN